MFKQHKFSYKIFLWTELFCLLFIYAKAADPHANFVLYSRISNIKTPPANYFSHKDTIPGKKDSLISRSDTLSFKVARDSVDAPVVYEAADSVVIDMQTEKIYLYSQGVLQY